MAARYLTVRVYRAECLDYGAAAFFERWYWQIKSTNGRILADSSEGYHRRVRALQGAQLVLGLDGIERMEPGDAWIVSRAGGDVRIVVEGGAA